MRVLLPKLAFGEEDAREFSGKNEVQTSLWYAESRVAFVDFCDGGEGAARFAEISLGAAKLMSFAATAHRESVEYQAGALLMLPMTGRFQLSWRNESFDLLGRKSGVFLANGGWQVEAGLCSAIRILVKPELLETLSGYVLESTGESSCLGLTSSPQVLRIKPDTWDSLISFLGVAYSLSKTSAASVLQLEDFTLRFIAMLLGESSKGALPETGLPNARVEEDRLQLIIDAVRADLSTPLSLNDMEVISGMSRRSIQYMFKERFGLSPIGWQLRERLSASYAALSDSSDTRTITQIAFDYGFASSSTFSLYFRRQFGVPPSKLR